MKDKSQLNIFEWMKKAEDLCRQSDEPVPGSLNIDAAFRAAVSADIKHAIDSYGRELSRYEVAARMSDLVGQEITASMLYSWTAESKEKHRFPCQYLPAFVMATGGRRAVEIISRHSGLFLLPSEEALRAEIQKIDEEMKLLKAEKKKRQLYLKETQEAV